MPLGIMSSNGDTVRFQRKQLHLRPRAAAGHSGEVQRVLIGR